jgi:hypothetical protein
MEDALKRMACHESFVPALPHTTGQTQFDADADGGVGPPIISGDNGIGIFQITKTNLCTVPNVADPFTRCPNVVFAWHINVLAAVIAFTGDKVPVAHQYPSQLAGSVDYQNFITKTVNRARAKATPPLAPIPAGVYPAPDFTTSGLIVAATPNQLLLDSVRGYNGYASQAGPSGPKKFGLPNLHEFTPDIDFLETVTDFATLSQPLSVWRQVTPAERNPAVFNSGNCGNVCYVDKVKSEEPQCAK